MPGKRWVHHLSFAILLVASAVGSGCRYTGNSFGDADLQHYVDVVTTVDYPDVQADCDHGYAELAATPPPLSLAGQTPETKQLTLQQAVQLALQNSEVLRDLGGLILSSPGAVTTLHDPAIQETDPRFGVEGALSAFDANWSTQAFFSKNDRALNNAFFGGGTRLLKQDLLTYSSQISKLSAFGTEMAATHNVEYDFNNAPGNADPNLPWATNFEIDVRHPLLQGGGALFNRIAGPGSPVGVYNGVLVSRINSDISIADFQAALRDFVNDVETAYWELYFAYRDLDAKIAARDRALDTWRIVKSRLEAGLGGADSARETRAREQYYRLETEVLNALSGRVQEIGRATTFRGTGGIYNNERRLRAIMGVPINDGTLFRPVTEPTMAAIRFPWEDVVAESLTRRVELRRQQWTVKRRELELTAAKNHLRPRLDAFGSYRWRGLGHDFIQPNGTGRPPFNDAVQNLFDGKFQEWQLGVEFALPVGYRQAHAAVRNAELNLTRAHAILKEQQRRVVLDVSNAIAEKDRAYTLARANLNRRRAAWEQLLANEAQYRNENAATRILDFLLDAQRRLADADSQYYRALTEYMMAVKHVHYAKGSLLDYNNIFLSEGPWPLEAHEDAMNRARRRVPTGKLSNYVLRPPLVSIGAVAQDFEAADVYQDYYREPDDTTERLPPPAPMGQAPLPEPAVTP